MSSQLRGLSSRDEAHSQPQTRICVLASMAALSPQLLRHQISPNVCLLCNFFVRLAGLLLPELLQRVNYSLLHFCKKLHSLM